MPFAGAGSDAGDDGMSSCFEQPPGKAPTPGLLGSWALPQLVGGDLQESLEAPGEADARSPRSHGTHARRQPSRGARRASTTAGTALPHRPGREPHGRPLGSASIGSPRFTPLDDDVVDDTATALIDRRWRQTG